MIGWGSDNQYWKKYGRSPSGPGFYSIILLLLVFLVYMIWNDFQLPKFMTEEQIETKGEIIAYGRGKNEYKYTPMITYAYRVDDSLYIHQKRKQLYFKKEESRPGSRLKIMYDKDEPAEHSIEGHYAYDQPYNRMSFFAETPNGSREIFIRNNIFKIEDYNHNGERIDYQWGEMYSEGDTIYVLPILPGEDDMPFMAFTLHEDTWQKQFLVSLLDSLVYK